MHPGFQDIHVTQSGESPFPSCSDTDDEPLLCAMPSSDPAHDHSLTTCLQRNLTTPMATAGDSVLRDNGHGLPGVRNSMKFPESLQFRPIVPQTQGLRVRFSLGRGSGMRAQGADVDNQVGGAGKKKMEGGSARSFDNIRDSGDIGRGSTSRNFAEGADSSSTDTDEDGELIQRAMKAKEEMLKRQKESKATTSKKRPRGGGTRPGGVSLKLLIDEGILTSGEGVLSLEYRGLHEKADLQPDGRIHWKEKLFDSPSAFSIFIKRLVNPTRKADDGWKTVKFAGCYLDHYKLELAKKRFGNDPVPATSNMKASSQTAAETQSPKRQRAMSHPQESVARGLSLSRTHGRPAKPITLANFSMNLKIRSPGEENRKRERLMDMCGKSEDEVGSGTVEGSKRKLGGVGNPEGVPDWLAEEDKEGMNFGGKDGLLHSEVFSSDGTLLQSNLLKESMG